MKPVGSETISLQDTEAFDRYRPYLRILAERALPQAIQARVDASDLVQQTIAEAWRCQDQFRGSGDSGQLAWLRGILSRIAAMNMRRHLGAQARDAGREVDVRDLVEDASAGIEAIAVASTMGPVTAAQHQEQLLALSTAIATLSEEQQSVLHLRHFQGLDHAAIADQLNKTEAAVRMIWIRALKNLKAAMQGDS